MNDSLGEDLRAELAAWEASGLRRELAEPDGIDFCSNDYLGLAREPRVVAAARAALEQYGAGAGAARLLRGNLPPHASAERACASWLGEEAALLFPSGWQANAALLPTLTDAEDLIFSDARNHASLIEGARASRARRLIFAHSDLEQLAAQLHRGVAARRRVVVVEDVYSMDGDLAPLGALLTLCEEYDAHLVVDHAHAAGLYEERISPAHPRVLARIVTGGKALGVAGGFVCARREVIELLINRGRAFVFTTAPPPAVAAALEAAIRIVRAEPERAERAHALAARLRTALRAGGLEALGESPIVPVQVGAADTAMSVAAAVRARGFDVRAVRPPTVPEGSSRLRLVCHATHEDAQVDELAAAVITAVRAHRPRTSILNPAPVESPPPRLLVVTGTDTDVGKTVVSALLVRAARAAQQEVGYFKPVQTGSDDDTGAVRALADLSPERAPRPAVSLPLPASVDQAAAAAGLEITSAALLAAIRRTTHATGAPTQSATWILEAAGGLRVPLNAREDQADLLQRLGAPVVLVARSGLGTLNHSLLTLEALAARRIACLALFLVGPPHAENVRTLAGRHPELPLFELPRFRSLTTKALDLWLSAHDLRPLWRSLPAGNPHRA